MAMSDRRRRRLLVDQDVARADLDLVAHADDLALADNGARNDGDLGRARVALALGAHRRQLARRLALALLLAAVREEAAKDEAERAADVGSSLTSASSISASMSTGSAHELGKAEKTFWKFLAAPWNVRSMASFLRWFSVLIISASASLPATWSCTGRAPSCSPSCKYLASLSLSD